MWYVWLGEKLKWTEFNRVGDKKRTGTILSGNFAVKAN
jgi:hypothetical protein